MTYDCSCDYEPAQFYCAAKPKARKQHKCYECAGDILPGERYERVTAKWYDFDGVQTMRTCERCYDLRTWVKNNVPCLCIMHGNQDEENDNAIDEATYRAKDETRGLRFGYLRRKVLRDRHNKAQIAL